MSETDRGPRVLVVDDDVQIVRIIRDNLRVNGYDVLDVQTGAGALDAVDRRHPDLVLLDLGLPDLDGMTLIERIRDHSQLPIVVLSARGEEVHLRPTEYELLKAFIANPDRVLTHHWLLRRVWGPLYGNEGNYLHVYVAGLRKKLEPNPKRPVYILTEPGRTYRLLGALRAI